jgi:hypothetical protein
MEYQLNSSRQVSNFERVFLNDTGLGEANQCQGIGPEYVRRQLEASKTKACKAISRRHLWPGNVY